MFLVPTLKELTEQIVPDYATQWKLIGTLLGLSEGQLKIIEYDNRHSVTECCRTMLQKWLELDPKATWEKIINVMNSRAMCNDNDDACITPCNATAQNLKG